MIRHCVFLRLSASADTDALAEVMQGLEDLVADLPGCNDFIAGPNRDFENKSPDHSYGFTLDAVDAQALADYAADPRHKDLGGRLVDMCEGGERGILVYDIEG
ncbi:Dabb family protein [uncultured Tateyamaria sp.]|uniref:Dabb family protein n=1 Tax=Tateyamaria sp. 1078 TaxID=3417464 RepID=UPI002635A9D8|nr:Dabb family protein [uncultured Tateyamaria sp.]